MKTRIVGDFSADIQRAQSAGQRSPTEGVKEDLNARSQADRLSKPKLRSKVRLDVVLAYDEHSRFEVVLKVYGAIVRRLAGRFEVRDTWWRFGGIGALGQLQDAAQFAATADVIFCCPGSRDELPPAVRDWISLWTAQRNHREGALAVLLPGGDFKNSAPSEARNYLEAVAQGSSMAFFVTEYDLHTQPESVARADGVRVSHGEEPIVNQIENRPEVRHWGINE